MKLPQGYSRYSIKSLFNEFKFTTVAKNSDQAWSKFVAQCFRTEPMKPSKEDYSISKV